MDGKGGTKVRSEYIAAIRRELMGPGSEFSIPDAEHEVISSPPSERYSIGILYPQNTDWKEENEKTSKDYEDSEVDSETEDEVVPSPLEDTSEFKASQDDEDDTDDGMDEAVRMSTQYLPSSMGITFFIRGDTPLINGTVSFGTYNPATSNDCAVPIVPLEGSNDCEILDSLRDVVNYDRNSNILRLVPTATKDNLRSKLNLIKSNERIYRPVYKLLDFFNNGHVREPHVVNFQLDFSSGKNYIDNNRDLGGLSVKITALRTKILEGMWSITIMLVNDAKADGSRADCIFQPRLHVSTENNNFSFVDNSEYLDSDATDDEEMILSLLYRNKKTYGSGLGVSTEWDIRDGKGSIWSEFIPEIENPPVSFDLPENTISKEKLSMKFFSDLNTIDKTEKLSVLDELVRHYDIWIHSLEEYVSTLDERYRPFAAKNIAKCKKVSVRMKSGIETLRKNGKAFDAFALANRAMYMQRVHLDFQKDTSNFDRYPEDEGVAIFLKKKNYLSMPDKYGWRPFQIAFLLMDVNSIVDERSSDRELVDLIWFPTGGGKTEAYLGLTAFTIFYRRFTNGAAASGTAVMMRYTLRLLTAQQFTRASTLICACEYIRKDCVEKSSKYKKYNLGKEEISIGLWIGGSHTPNKNIEAKEKISELNKARYGGLKYAKDRYNKFQVLKCPWCGTKLVKDEKDGKLIGKFGYLMRNNSHFYFSCTHDDCDFTSRLPIQVVDEELYLSPPTLLFGTVDKFAMMPWNGKIGRFFASDDDSKRPPNLIIQDELHLISGALGTMVGIYETAIDALCERNGIKPKIIASTATIRRAREQCSALYNRDVVQFPPQGLDAEDSFFARELKISYEKNIFGRTYVGLMPSGKTKAMMEIRAAAALLQNVNVMDIPDEVKDKYWTLTVYFNSLKDLGKASTLVGDDIKDFIIRISNRLLKERRLITTSDELTSRVGTTELNETLDKLEKTEYSKENWENGRYASNILLATNMISVGIDIPRLNVMLIVGQPKLTSEYIQASSRIGRAYPGVAFIQYDTKSRDRSHYEHFKSYHESFYRFVEPTGVTPFSRPARERALHAVLVAIVRNRLNMIEDKDAADFDKDQYSKELAEIKDYVINRITKINARTNMGFDSDITEISEEIDQFFDKWQELVEQLDEGEPLSFGLSSFGKKNQIRGQLLKAFNSDEFEGDATETLTSMRNVDIQVPGKLIIWGK